MAAIPALHPSLAFSRRATAEDSGVRLSRALLAFMALLLAATVLRPGQSAVATPWVVATWAPLADVLLSLSAWVPFGFLLRRARPRDASHWAASVLAYSVLLAAGLELLRTVLHETPFTPVLVGARVGGAMLGAGLLVLIDTRVRLSNGAVTALLLDLPVMSVVYLLLPLLWVSSTLAVTEPLRIVAVALVCIGGASLLGSIAKALSERTVRRAWWIVGGSAALWAMIGTLPLLLAAPRPTIAIIGVCAVYAGWRGRLRGRPFQERRFEVPALRAALPFFAGFAIVTAIWPAHTLRTMPLLDAGMTRLDSLATVWVPLMESLVAAALLGYMAAEWRGRREFSYRVGAPAVLTSVAAILVPLELLRAFLAADGASSVRAGASIAVAMYGAWLYHLQRDHVKQIARRARS
jgi:hypothetical protein